MLVNKHTNNNYCYQSGLVQVLLTLLQSDSLPVTNAAATRAQLVACIKTMAASPLFGQQVRLSSFLVKYVSNLDIL